MRKALVVAVAFLCLFSVGIKAFDSIDDVLALGYQETEEDRVTEKIAMLQTAADVDGEDDETAMIEEADDIGVDVEKGKIRVNTVERCESILNELRKRDDSEQKNVVKELAMVKLIRIQLHKLNAVGSLKDIEKGSDLDVMLLSLDLGRDYAEVNGPDGIFELLDRMEAKMRAQLNAFRAETLENRQRCVQMCSSASTAEAKALSRAKLAINKAIVEDKSVLQSMGKEEGKYSEMFKVYTSRKREEDAADSVRARELALIRILRNKLKHYRHLKSTDAQMDVEKAEPKVGLKDWQKDVEEAGATARLADILLEISRNDPEIDQVEILLKQLEDKILKESLDGHARLQTLINGLTTQRSSIEKIKTKSFLAKKKVSAAEERGKKHTLKMHSLQGYCKNFKSL